LRHNRADMAADPSTLNVTCPHCAARYLLPAHLLGPGGARVRCPGCSRSFDVAPPLAPEPAATVAIAQAAHAGVTGRDRALVEAESEVEARIREHPASSTFGEEESKAVGETPAVAGHEAAHEPLEQERAGEPWSMPPAGTAVAHEEPMPADAAELEAEADIGSPATAAQAPEAVAREVLEAVARRSGADLAAAAAAGHLFARHGPQIFAAFDEYRKRAGDAGSAPFRAALRGLWGIDLPEVIRRR
jgi:predicted Zn finger-like uncharacterized protein